MKRPGRLLRFRPFPVEGSAAVARPPCPPPDMELGRALEREGMLAGWIPPFRRP